MKFYTALTIAFTTALALLTSTPTDAATNPIVIKGYKMFDNTTGANFAARGIDYYPRPNDGEFDKNNIDFFTDDRYDIWSKDIKYFAAAGANAIRLYAVDPSKSHDKFMCALSALGIYVLVDLGASCEGCAITNDAFPTCYPPTLKTRGEQIILAFAKYDNVLAFSAGNEVNHVVTDPKKNSPCQKKFIRDMRTFLAKCNKLRPIPVGVVLADHHREDNAKYYNCRTDSLDKLENAEWYGLNAYQYCDNSVTEMSKATGFTNMVTDFEAYKTSIPVMLTEFGCLAPTFPTEKGYDAQRSWLQAGWLFAKEFREVFSGGFVFEYSTENANSKGDAPYPFTKYGGQNYGLGYFKPENCNHASIPCTFVPMPNYDSLAKQYKKVANDKVASKDSFKPADDRLEPPMCPTGFASLASVMWEADEVASALCPEAAVTFTCPANSAVPGSNTVGNDNDGNGKVHPNNGGTDAAATSTNTAATNNAAGSVTSQRTLEATLAVIALSVVITAHFL